VRAAEPIAIAAAGVVTPIGQDVEAFWSSLVTGASGISQIERFPVGDLRVGRGGEIKKLARIRSWDRVPDCRATRLLVAAADELVAQSGFRPLPLPPARVAVVVGTALGGVEEGEKALAGDPRRRRLRGALYDGPAWGLARWLGAAGPVITVSTACASGATALAVGADLLRQGEVDAVVAGGYDVLCRFVMRGFDALRSLTRETVRPFDRRRSGLLLGEAAALVLLLRERDADRARLGTLLGYGSASDAFHIAAPDPTGEGLERAIRAALAQAGVTPADIDLVSTHGTGTPKNDPIETMALERILGPRVREVPANSIKPTMGHTMGAAATLEAIMCLLASRHGLIPATPNLEEPDPRCQLDHVIGRARVGRPRVSLSTSLGFGGCNAALVLEGAG
jgi:3-oxoacyl-[acyl-carrier-protein] synthase II